MDNEKIGHIVGATVFWGCICGIVAVVMILISGCAASQTIPEIVTQSSGTIQIIRETVRSTDWLFSILLLGSVAGVFAGLNGFKTGFAATAACIGGLWLKAALTSTWVYWMCGALFIGSLIIAGTSILFKNKAVKELIMSCQYLKKVVPDQNRVAEVFNATQSTDTKSLVNAIKSSLKIKGII